MFRPLFSLLSPAGSRARLSILIFHRVLQERDPLFPGEVTAAEFDAICRWLKEWFDVLPLAEAVHRLRDRNLPRRSLSITFDDGYADNHELAMPVLRKHGLTATFFVATQFLDGGRMWNDTVIESIRRTRRREITLAGSAAGSVGNLRCETLEDRQTAIARLIGATKYLPQAERDAWVRAVELACEAELPDDLMMTSEMVRSLRRGGQDIGAHTSSHPILARLEPSAIEAEIRLGRDRLEEITDARVPLFAYPNGKPGSDYTSTAVEIVRSLGFDAAVSTAWGSASVNSKLFELPRFTPWDRTRTRFALRMAKNLMSAQVAQP